MKKILVRSLAVASVAALLNTSYVLADDVQAPATPGTAAATDSRTQLNNPPGQDAQATLHPREGSKEKKALASQKQCTAPKSKSDDSSVTASGPGAKATKTPQVSMPPSTPNQ